MLRSYSIAYVWNAEAQLEQVTGPLERPVFSWQGPPSMLPQWSVDQVASMPLMFSMMSISPTPGQFVAPTARAESPSIQNAGQ